MSTLYRKYRPKLWSEVFGQEVIKNTLKNEILNDKLAHAYIFSGPRGVGKTTIARLVAKTLNCKNRKNGDIEPCGKCESCVAIDNGSSLELIEIDAASNTGVDDVRELKKIVRIPAQPGAYKVFIIDEVHMLSKQAFNALLKTLEEPPERVIFILATTEINKILDTILSRCQIFKFKKASTSEILSDLKFICENEGLDVTDEVLIDVAEKADGGFRDAESLLGKIISSLNQKTINKDDIFDIINKTNKNFVLDFVSNIYKREIKNCFNIVNDVIENQIGIDDFVLDVIEFFRKVLIYKYNSDCENNWKNLSNEVKNIIEKISKDVDFDRLSFIIKKFIQVKLDIKNSDIVQLPLELAIVELCSDYNEQKIENKDNVKHVSGLKINNQKDVSVLSIMKNDINSVQTQTEQPSPKLADIVKDNGLLNHVDPERRERIMKKFGLNKDGKKDDNNIEPKGQSEQKTEQKIEKEPENDVSVFDILKDEFAENLE